MCCSTGICGPDVDPVLPRVAGMLARLKEGGVHVERHNLAQQPMAFVQNAEVRELLNREGVGVLPLIFIDGALVLKGRYPDQETGARWIREHVGDPTGADLLENHQTERTKMNTPQGSENQSEGSEPLKNDNATCGPGCGCNAGAKAGKTRWILGVLVLAAAGAMVVRAVSRADGPAVRIAPPDFVAPSGPPAQAAGEKSASDSSTETPAAETTVGTPIGAFFELNDVAAQTDAVLIFLPGKEAAAGIIPAAQMKEAARMIEEKAGKKCGLFTLKPGTRDYEQIGAQMALPGVLAMVKGGGMSAISGDITETKLVQGFVAASSAGGCGSGGGGCGPASSGCK